MNSTLLTTFASYFWQSKTIVNQIFLFQLDMTLNIWSSMESFLIWKRTNEHCLSTWISRNFPCTKQFLLDHQVRKKFTFLKTLCLFCACTVLSSSLGRLVSSLQIFRFAFIQSSTTLSCTHQKLGSYTRTFWLPRK